MGRSDKIERLRILQARLQALQLALRQLRLLTPEASEARGGFEGVGWSLGPPAGAKKQIAVKWLAKGHLAGGPRLSEVRGCEGLVWLGWVARLGWVGSG